MTAVKEAMDLCFAASVASEGEIFEIWRLERTIGAIDFLEWLKSFEAFPKFYWENLAGETKIAAIGKEWELAHIPKFIESNMEVRFYGAMHFDLQTKSDPLWKGFPFCGFFLPSFEIIATQEKITFAVNRLKRNMGKIAALPPARKTDAPSFHIHQREDFPTFEDWKKRVHLALKSIEKKEMDKVVLARRVTFHCDKTPDPISVAKRLGNTRHNSYLFLYQTASDAAFVGASPERLYVREYDSILSKAIAGTRRRGSTPTEDERLQKELLSSAKDIKEFLYVKDFIEKKLSPYCRSYELCKAISILQTASVQHLHSSFTGTLKETSSDDELITSLHPTPATLGVPRDAASHFLQQNEGFGRGLYAAPIGWISPKGAEIVVGIRSCLIRKNTIHLFSGVGIVPGSDPQEEWDELECKIAPFIKGVFCDHR